MIYTELTSSGNENFTDYSWTRSNITHNIHMTDNASDFDINIWSVIHMKNIVKFNFGLYRFFW